MNKSYIITFSICVILLFSIAAVLLMIVLPDQVGILEGNADKYDSIVKSKYTFESTKNISTEIIQKDYVVTNDQISSYKKNYLYVPGNSDPFSPKIQDSGTNNTTTGTNQSNTTTSGTSNSNTTTSNNSTTAEQKTTNSNGGVANPESTNK